LRAFPIPSPIPGPPPPGTSSPSIPYDSDDPSEPWDAYRAAEELGQAYEAEFYEYAIGGALTLRQPCRRPGGFGAVGCPAAKPNGNSASARR
jgi:hypothetical protein